MEIQFPTLTEGENSIKEKLPIAMDPLQNYKARLYCEICDIKFGNRKDLATHNNVVHSCKPFECEVCHKKFSERFTLKVHFRIHTGERPHVCSYCNKSFSQACNLTTHKKRYHFKRMAVLKSRQQLDTKPVHKCPHCTIMFRRIEHVKAHILSTHVNRASSSTNGGTRSPSTSSGVSSSSSTSESQSVSIKRESEGRILLHCKDCRLSFPDRMAFEKHRQAHFEQQNLKKSNNLILVSNSTGQKVSLSDLVSQIKQKNEAMSVKQEPKDVIQKLSGLGMEISLHPVKREAPNDLGLVISNVQSVSQKFFDELEMRKPMMLSRPGPRCSKIGISPTVKQENRTQILPQRRSNGMRTVYKAQLPQISNMGMRDPLELPTFQTPSLQQFIKQPEEIKTEQEVVLSSTRRSNRSLMYQESEQPKHISIITKHKNGKTTKRRIFPCGQCTSKFENIETRKMHFMAVHNSSSSSGSTARKSTASPATISRPPPIIPQIIAAYEHE